MAVGSVAIAVCVEVCVVDIVMVCGVCEISKCFAKVEGSCSRLLSSEEKVREV